MGRISRIYRTHPYHYATYGPSGISPTPLGQWPALRQPQISRFETGPPLQHLDTLRRWAQVLRIPALVLWFRLPDDSDGFAGAGPAQHVRPDSAPDDENVDEPVLVAPWNHPGTVEAVVVLSGGDPGATTSPGQE